MSYGADGRLQVNPCNPFEIGLGKLVDFEKGDFIGKAALQKIVADGVNRQRTGFTIDGEPILHFEDNLTVVDPKGVAVGTLSEATYSPRCGGNIGVGMIAKDAPDDLFVTYDNETRQLHLARLPFV